MAPYLAATTPVAVKFITVVTLDGLEVAVNVEQITSITRSRDGEGNKLLTEEAACVIGLVNGKFLSTAEDCRYILRRISDEQR